MKLAASSDGEGVLEAPTLAGIASTSRLAVRQAIPPATTTNDETTSHLVIVSHAALAVADAPAEARAPAASSRAAELARSVRPARMSSRAKSDRTPCSGSGGGWLIGLPPDSGTSRRSALARGAG